MTMTGDAPATAEQATDAVSLEERSHAAVRGLFGRDALYMMLWAVQIVLAALLTPVTTRLLGPSGFGSVAAGVALMQVFVAIGGFSLYTAVQRAYEGPGGEDAARRIVTIAINLSLLTFAVAYGTGELWCPLIGLGHFPTTIRYALLWAALTAMSNAALGLIRSRDRLAWFATVSLLQSFVAEALALSLVIFVSHTSSSYLLGQMLAQGAAVAVSLAVIRPRLLAFTDRGLVFETLRYSSALVPAVLSSYVLDASDRLVIHADLGAAAVGRYVVARNVGGFSMILLSILNGIWMPRLFALKDRGLQGEVLAMSRDTIYGLVVAATVALAMVSPVLLWIWVPPSYHPHGLLLVTALVAAAAVPMAGAQSATQVLLLRDRTFPIAVGTMAAAALNLGLNLALVPLLGIGGSAGITLCCFGLQLAFLHRAAARVLPRRGAPRRLVALVVAGTGLCIASAVLPTTGVGIALRLLLAAGAGTAFIAAFAAVVAPSRLSGLRSRFGRLAISRSRPATGTG